MSYRPSWKTLILRTGASIALASLILTSQSSAQETQPNSDDTERDFEPPQLLYLTWQEDNPRGLGGKTYPVWKPDGEVLTEKEAAELRKLVRNFALFDVQEDQLHPLILIFKVDARATNSPVMPTLLNASGTRPSRGGSQNEPRTGLIVSSIAPSQRDLLIWPEQGTVEVRYPVENPTVVKTHEGPPQGRIDVALGVTWELDPSYAMERDPDTRQLKRAPSKFAGVLITNPNEADANIDYEVRAEVRGGTILKTHLHTAKSNPTGEASRVDISEPVDNPQQITKLFIVRQRHAVKKFEDLTIKRDLLFKAVEEEKPNE